ncbi:MAG: hypothetical protein P4L28_07240 [Paludibacteraceae bacterium]|nr:hypothetical protein [Paludibacteraceae bacterium]
MKILYRIVTTLVLLIGIAATADAQQGFGTSSPDKSSILDMVASDKGVLYPRVALTGLTDVTTIPSAATYLTVFNTATAGTAPNDVTPGYYYWNGTKWIRLLSVTDLTFDNGLTNTSGDVEFGGTLTQPTTIAASGTNTLALTGLQSGSPSTDSVVVANATTGVLKQVSADRFLASKTTNTLVSAASKLTSTVNGVSANLAPATGTIANTLGFDATGTLVIQSPTSLTITTTNTLGSSANTITSTVNGLAATAPAVNSVANTSSANTMLTTVNGIAGSTVPIINTNVLTAAASKLTSTVNGVVANLTPTAGTIANTLGFDATGALVLQAPTSVTTTNGLTAAASKLTSTVNGVSANLAPITGTIANTLGFDATGALVLQSPTTVTTTNTLGSSTNTITSTVNGIVATAPAVNSVANTSSANTLLTTVNGVAGSTVPIINTNGLTAASSKLTSTVNGVTANLTPTTGTIANMLGFDATGALVLQSPTSVTTTNTLTSLVNTITSTVNGIVATAPAVNSVANTSSANTLATTVNGVAGTTVPIINTNVLSNTSGNLISTINGLASASVPVLISANNGLTSTTGNVQLGGALTKATTIAATAANTLTLTGLQLGAVTDSVLTVDVNGVLRKRTSGNSIVTKTSAYTPTIIDETILVNASSAAVTITLPVAIAGKKYIVKKIDTSTNAVNVIATSGTIDGNAAATGISGTLPWQGWVIQFDGSNWYVISRI